MEIFARERKLIKITHSLGIASILKINLNLYRDGEMKKKRKNLRVGDINENYVILTLRVQILFVSLKSGICVVITSYYATDSCRCWLVLFELALALLVLENVIVLLVDDDASFAIFSVKTRSGRRKNS
jgi:hypothetical protein